MMTDVCDRTRAIAPSGLNGTLLYDEPMSRHTSWRVGGPADLLYVPADRDDLSGFLRALPAATPVVWLGLGSNILVRDGGIRGAVICVHKALAGLRLVSTDVLHADAGVPGAKIARFSVRHNLTGAEFLAGIPGTLGGALAMNAGAFGAETWHIVRKVETIDRAGQLHERSASEYHVGYRTVCGIADEWFTAAELVLEPNAHGDGTARINRLLAERGASQPVQTANAGSVFRNPPDDFAARLIDASGLKGTRYGNAYVSSRHANFIINEGRATANDIEQLIERIRKSVFKRFQVALELEVHIIGDSIENR